MTILKISKNIPISCKYFIFTIFFGILFHLEVDARPGGGGSYRSSSSSSSGSSYRSSSSSSSSSYRSSSSSSSRSSSSSSSSSRSSSGSNHSNSTYSYTPSYSDTQFSYKEYTIHYKVKEDTSVNIQEFFRVNIEQKGDRLIHKNILFPIFLQMNDRCKSAFNEAGSNFQNGYYRTFYIQEQYEKENNYCQSLYYFQGTIHSDTELLTNYSIYRNFAIVSKSEQIVYYLPLTPKGGKITNLEKVSFQIEIPEPDKEANLELVSFREPQKTISEGLSFQKEDRILTGEFTKKEEEVYFLKLTIPLDRKKFINLDEKFYKDSVSLEKSFPIFDSLKIDLQLQKNGILDVEENYFRVGDFSNSYESINRKLPVYHLQKNSPRYEKSSDLVYYISKKANTEYSFSYFSYFWYELHTSSFQNSLQLTHSSYGNYSRDSRTLLWHLNPLREFAVKDLEIKIILPEGLSQKDIKNIFLETSDMNLPYEIEKQDTVIFVRTKGIYKQEAVFLKIEFLENKIGQINIFYLTYLALLFQYDSHPERLVFFSVLFSLSILLTGFLVYRDKKKKKAKLSILAPLREIDPSFSESDFLQKVESTVRLLNEAWFGEKMQKVRSFVSGGIYTRFKNQLEIMQKEGNQNIMSDWKLLGLEIVETSLSQSLCTVHVRLKAQSKDTNVSLNLTEEQKKERLKYIPASEYVEYWSFIRSQNAKSNKGYNLFQNQCPNCGAETKNMTDQNKCKSCNAVYNSGEYDWVLAEITQEEEWTSHSAKEISELKTLQKDFPFLHRQILEDRASVLFWKWVRSFREGDSRFIERDIYENRRLVLKEGGNYIREVAVGSVDIIHFQVLDFYWEAKLLIKWSAAFSPEKLPHHKESELIMRADKDIKNTFGLAEPGCDSCGAPLPEIDAHQCSYCGNSIPTKLKDWLFYNLVHK